MARRRGGENVGGLFTKEALCMLERVGVIACISLFFIKYICPPFGIAKRSRYRTTYPQRCILLLPHMHGTCLYTTAKTAAAVRSATGF